MVICDLLEDNVQLMVEGGNCLDGRVQASGAKNAALPIMAASILAEGTIKLDNFPIVGDVITLKKILEALGMRITFSNNGSASLSSDSIISHILPSEECKRMRASFFVTGPLLSKFGEATVTLPGGCVIGNRPVDIHLKGFKALGAKIKPINGETIRIEADRLVGSKIVFPFPSMGATENLMMAASIAKGKTELFNVAREPEIIDLAKFLNNIGAKIEGAGTEIIKIEGVRELNYGTHKIIPDRIEAGTYSVAAAISNGNIQIENIKIEHLEKLIAILKKIGVFVETDYHRKTLNIFGSENYQAVEVSTGPFPGFPTDLQPILVSLLSISNGQSIVTDTVFPKRFCYVSELQKMNAQISVMNNSAVVDGVKSLNGTDVFATDLRGGAALILAGLVANGRTTISNFSMIKRGYERIEEKLDKIGANVTVLGNN